MEQQQPKEPVRLPPLEQPPRDQEQSDGTWSQLFEFRRNNGSDLQTARFENPRPQRGGWTNSRAIWEGHVVTAFSFPDSSQVAKIRCGDIVEQTGSA